MKTLKIRMNLHYLPSSSVLADIEEAENVGTGTPTVFFNMNKNANVLLIGFHFRRKSPSEVLSNAIPMSAYKLNCARSWGQPPLAAALLQGDPHLGGGAGGGAGDPY